jgi:hypothetical protein
MTQQPITPEKAYKLGKYDAKRWETREPRDTSDWPADCRVAYADGYDEQIAVDCGF